MAQTAPLAAGVCSVASRCVRAYVRARLNTQFNLCLSQSGFRCDGGGGNDPCGLFHAVFCAVEFSLSSDGTILMKKQPGK